MNRKKEKEENLDSKIEKLMQFFKESGITYSKFLMTNLDFKAEAYPNNDFYINIPGQHDTQKWLNTVKNIYQQEKEGISRVTAIKRSTYGWNIIETFDFLNWLKYYESGDHLKYKFAQLWYENGEPGYFLHIKKDPVQEQPAPSISGKDIGLANDHAEAEAAKNERKQVIEKQRNKIIGRLDSAEKLLRSPDGQIFSGKEFETLLEAIYQLKKKIQMINKISTSQRLYDDLIVREANILNKKGFIKASEVLYSLAENIPTAVSPGDPAGPGNPGAPGGLPSMGPGMPQNAPSSTVPGSVPNDNSPQDLKQLIPAEKKQKEDKKPEGIEEFLEGMNTSKFTTEQDQEAEDDLLEVSDVLDVLEVSDLETTAQVAPIDEPLTTVPAPAPLSPTEAPLPVEKVKTDAPKDKLVHEKPLEVSEEDLENKNDMSISQFDKKVDEVFSNINVQDIIDKLEDLSKIFKTREVPRQLSVVDMMLDSIGLASFFPQLSEATNKALESNNYISTRVEDILSKLRGQVTTKDIDLRGDNTLEKEEVIPLKNKLKQDEEKEKNRKQQRKEQEQADLDASNKEEAPEIEIDEDLSPPKAPAPVAPAVTPPLPLK